MTKILELDAGRLGDWDTINAAMDEGWLLDEKLVKWAVDYEGGPNTPRGGGLISWDDNDIACHMVAVAAADFLRAKGWTVTMEDYGEAVYHDHTYDGSCKFESEIHRLLYRKEAE